MARPFCIVGRWVRSLVPLALGSLASAQAAGTDAEWTSATKDPANTRYSALAQITAANVNQLKLAFSLPTGASRGHEAAPIVAGGTMFIVTPYPNVVYALDLTRPGANVPRPTR